VTLVSAAPHLVAKSGQSNTPQSCGSITSHRLPWNTGSSAFAGDEAAGCGRIRRPLRSRRRQHNSSRRLVCSVQLSPRVPVAIKNDAVSRIAAVSAAATRAAGVFIVTRSRCRSPRWFAKLRTTREIIELRRNRHRQRDLGRKHCEGDDQTQRQRADRERGRDGLGQSGRCNRGNAAIKTGSAGRPYHGPKSLNAQANHLRHPRILQQSRATLGQNCLENGEMGARPASRLSGYAIVFIAYASAAMLAGSSTSAQGRQSIETNPGVCSIRRNQARIAGKVARS
jgi:hypothetical protein